MPRSYTQEKFPLNFNTPMIQYFEFKRQPFPQVVDAIDVYLLPHVRAVAERCEFAFQTNQFYAVIGAVGCGKSSALRYSCSCLEKKHAKVLSITGGIWSFTELLRQILSSLDYDFRQYQPATMVRLVQEKLIAIQAEGRKCILLIDEAHLLKNDVFAQLHILCQHPQSKQPLFSLMLCGQEELTEKLENPHARPLMSRIAQGYFVPPIQRDDFHGYIEHHMKLAGAKGQVFDELGLDALWQISSANLRSIGNNALVAIQWAANNDNRLVTAECVRLSQRPMWGQLRTERDDRQIVMQMPDYSGSRR